MSGLYRATLFQISLFIACVSAASCSGTTQGAKPVVEERIEPLFFGPPPTLNEMVLQADAVVLGTVRRNRPEDVPSGAPGIIFVNTLYVLDVKEVFFTSENLPSIRDQVSVRVWGGTRDRGDRIVKTTVAGLLPLRDGDSYVIFLRRRQDAWIPAWGPNGIYHLMNGRVAPFGSETTSSAQAGRPQEEFIAALRNHGIQ